MVYHRSSKDSSQADVKPKNIFQNDGSFLEMFKKMQETSATSSSSSSSSSSSTSSSLNQSPVSSASFLLSNKDTTPTSSISDSVKTVPKEILQTSENEGKPMFNSKFPLVGKRRGGRVLPTGKVKKVKVEPKEEKVEEPKDAWSQYLAEVKKYKETTCEEEGKTRPLVK